VAPPEFMARHNPGHIELRPNVPSVRSVRDRCRRELAAYYAAIENLDWNVGRILKALDDAGMTGNTHILFFADHGDMHGSHGQFVKMTPYEESIRFRFSSAAPKISRSAPSGRHRAYYARPRVRKRARPSEPDSAYLQSVLPTRRPDSVDKPTRGLVTREGWKYVCFEGVSFLMFNLNEDPFEPVNVAHNTRYRAERRKLTGRFETVGERHRGQVSGSRRVAGGGRGPRGVLTRRA
jgi:arylsulfatase A-like enzyme